VRRFQLHLVEKGLSICNRNRIMTGVRFLFRVTLRRHDLAAEVYHLKEPQKLPLVMSPDEAKGLLVMSGNPKVHVMLALGYGCGLRAAGGRDRSAARGDIDSAQMIIRIAQGKGRKDCHVMLPPEVLALLRQWWKARSTRHVAGVPPQERWLFPGRRPGLHLTTRQLSRLLHETAEAAGIRKRISLHSACRRRASSATRHSFATHLLEGGTDIRADPGFARSRQVGYDGTLHTRGHGPHRRHREPARAAWRHAPAAEEKA
jgi:integrase/recombinase XerD